MKHVKKLKISIWLLIALVFLGPINSFAAMSGGGMGGGGMGGGGMGGGSTIIDPPLGGSFKDPVEMGNKSTTPGVVEVDLELKRSMVNVNGTMANLMTFNGAFPGPTIRVKKGETLKVNFKNSLPYTSDKNMLGFEKNHTNLHTHGFHVSPEEPSDAAHLNIPAGGTYNYVYDLSKQDAGSMSFYHGHLHGLSAEQYWAGAVGAIFTEDETPVLSSYETHTMILKDISLNGSEPTPHSTMQDYMMGKEGNIIMVNGQVNPVLAAKPGQVQRWRIVNASNARFYKLSLAGHNLNLVGTDAGLLDKPYSAPYLTLSPGERVDVLVKASKTTGNYKLLALPYSRMGNMTSPQITLLTMADKGSAVNNALPTSVNPMAMRMNMDTSMLPKRTLTLSMGNGNAYINGQDFDVNPYTIMSDVNSYEVWEIVNNSNMDHPFHQHVNASQILSITGGDANYNALYTKLPAMKDTILVPKFGKVTMLVPIKDYTGMTMFHCHILEHEDIGMMGMWHIMDGMMPPMPM